MKHLLETDSFERPPEGRVGRHNRSRLPRLAAVAIASALFALLNPYVQASAPTEYEVKAAYLYNFGRFVQWPVKARSDERSPFTICVLGKDPFGPALDATLRGETIDGKDVVGRRISDPQQAMNCRILFISSSEDRQLKEILTTLDKASVLTVSDMRQFVRRGGMVQFILEENRVRFEVNLTTSERAGLILSSQLLKLAIIVRSSPQPGD